jgi:cytochrome P450
MEQPSMVGLDPTRVVEVDIFSDDARQRWMTLAAEWAQQPPFFVVNYGIPQVVVGRYADVRDVLMSPERFTSTPPPAAGERFDAFMGLPHVGAMNGDPHDRVRRILQPFFGTGGIAQYQPSIERHVETLLDEIEARGDEFDAVVDFSRQLIPRIMLGTMFAIDETRCEVFIRMNEELERVASAGGYPTSYVEAFREARRVIDAMIAERVDQPSEDFVSGLIQGRDRGEPISDDEIAANVFAICVAAMTTTSTESAMMLYAWIRHREQFAVLDDEPEGLAAAVEECLRLHPAGLFVFPRFAVDDTDLGGTTIRADMPVHACVAAANLDPTVYPDPLSFDIRRNPKHTLTFGAGPHFCAGGLLARRILQTSLRAFMRRFPQLRLADDDFEPTYHGQLGEVAPVSIRLRIR